MADKEIDALRTAFRAHVRQQLQRDLTPEELRGLEELLKLFPLLKAPADPRGLSTADQHQILQAINEGRTRVEATVRQVAESIHEVTAAVRDSARAAQASTQPTQAPDHRAGSPFSPGFEPRESALPAGLEPLMAAMSQEIDRKIRQALAPLLERIEAVLKDERHQAPLASAAASAAQQRSQAGHRNVNK